MSERLSAAEQIVSRLSVTRETILERTGDLAEAPPAASTLLPAYRQFLAIVEQAPDGLRVEDICRVLNTGMESKHTESPRAKVERMVARGVLVEPGAGLFTLPQPSRMDTTAQRQTG
ncbi:hypothetical protein ACIBP6_45385 [Nonomuraea terrae]|uniref:hypothetical protein n=1 Tax=Nonomuraea terrae TaxID=2530383 RepID=UPI0037B3F5BE